jgi:hypothetical protein
MAARITLAHPSINSGNPVNVFCNQVTVSGKDNITDDPYVNGVQQSEIHTQSFENLKYSIQGINFTGAAASLAYTDVLTIYKNRYDTTAATTCKLRVVYGYGTAKTLVGVDGTTMDIKVVMEGFNFPIDAKNTKEGYMPVGSITFVETA